MSEDKKRLNTEPPAQSEVSHPTPSDENLGSLAFREVTLGIAHDLNNALCASVAHLHSLERLICGDEKMEKRLHAALSGCEHAAYLTKSLLDHSKDLQPLTSTISLNDITQKTCEFVSSLIPENVSLTYRLDIPVSLVANPSQVQQALTNLILNGVRAMPEGGEIRVLVSHNAQHAFLSVEDTGCGMDESEIKKALQPFNTTWKESKGYGLGLPMVRRIIKHHRGELEIQSTKGTGTTMTLRFPYPGEVTKVIELQEEEGSPEERPCSLRGDSGSTIE
ncbi:MAG: HAMP domain-containing histidine kinase [Bdellovibrionales bacterium]|nr:HAMP domain-containing histidine kinase [Bdellovibrionales bacterium]